MIRSADMTRPGNRRTQAVIRFLIMVPLLGAALMIPAGTIHFWQAWTFLAVTVVFSLGTTIYFARKDPKLLERRMEWKEPSKAQRLFRWLWIPGWAIGLVLAGFDHRTGWSQEFAGGVPLWLILFGQVLIASSYVLIFIVLESNSFASSTVRVERGQTVMTGGPYRFVRHPMYSALVVLLIAMPFALGSYVVLPIFVMLGALVVFRLIHEEKLLVQELAGYSEYRLRTRFRLIPFLF